MAKKKSKSDQEADKKYLTTGLMLLAGSLGLGVLTVIMWVVFGVLYVVVPVGAAVLLLIGGGSVLKYFLGDNMNWD